MKAIKPLLFVISLLIGNAILAATPNTPNLQSLANNQGFQAGFVGIYHDAKAGKLYLKIDNLGEFIYQSSLPQGLGSNDVGLDRGQLGTNRLVEFQLAGDKLLLVQKNTYYRATATQAEQQAMEQAFASAVVWGFPIVDRNENSFLVDASEFILQDVHGVVRRLKSTQQGSYKLDKSRSALFLPKTKSFPDNTELEATITFTGNEPGNYVRQVAADPFTISLRMHHSFIRLPKPGFIPRKFHPQSGYFDFSYQDYSQPINEPLSRQFISRHRLAKKDPKAAISEPVEPIIYYLDHATPEPVRTALIDGALWWDQAFAAAGYRNAFQIKILPKDADPMDVRYNLIQWVHRATRGWSYGYSVTDPRNGEIIKGHVTLGSLRVRQDYLIAQGILSRFNSSEDDNEMMRLALARIRQLSAHEVGHTLGIAHNFAASTFNNASVMDYPHPYFSIDTNNKITANTPYSEGIGAWDKAAIVYGYSEFPAADEARQLARIIADNQAKGYIFISDPDSRSMGSAHARSSMWDNGSDPLAELVRVKNIRQIALDNFGSNSLKSGRAWSDLEEILVPVYYFHRYQIEAAAKLIAGVDYRYQTKSKQASKPDYTVVAAKRQQQTINELVATLTPEFLALSPQLLQQIPPKIYGSSRTRESAPAKTGVTFDPVSLAAASAQHSLSLLLHPQRLARLEQQHAINPKIPSISQLLTQINKQVIIPQYQGLNRLLHQRVVQLIYSNYLNLMQSQQLTSETKAIIYAELERQKAFLKTQILAKDLAYSDFYLYQSARLEQFQLGKKQPLIALPTMPPGSPI